MMARAVPVQLQELLESKRRQFAAGLPARMAELAQLQGSVRAHPMPGDFERLARIAHGLAGSSALFGFDALGAQARALQLELQSATAGGATPPGQRNAAIDAAIQRVRDCASGAR